MWRTARVRALQELALQLARDGRTEESLATVQEALAVAARLRFGMAAYVEADLRHTRAHVLLDAGRWEEAAAEAADAAEARRHLGGELGSDQLSRLTDSLEIRANALTRLRRREEADELSAEVVRLRAKLPWREQVRALLNRSATLLDAGRYEEGLAAARELFRIASARRGPDLSEPELVAGLSNLAVLLRFNGRWKEAVQVQGIAVEQLRVLAGDVTKAPPAPLADLAAALANQSLLHLERGRPEDAEAPGQEALEIRARLARRSTVHRSDLSDSLNNQAAVLVRLGRGGEAEVLAERCVALRRALHQEHPSAFEVKLANALATHGHALTSSERPEAGLTVGREAVDRFRSIAVSDPSDAGPWLASALDSLAEAAALAGFGAECLAASREALAVGDAVLAERRRAFGITHAEHLLLAAQRCRALAGTTPGECRGWAQEALALLEELAVEEPEAYDVLLTSAREMLAGWRSPG